MSQTRPETSEELLETIQNTDPTSDPADAVTTGVEGYEQTAGFSAADEEVERLRAERDGLIDRLARLQAEFENARRRAEKERGEFREYATGSAVEQFLPILDNFQLALKSNSTAEQFRAGVELIAKQMDEALRTLNVVPVETTDVEFDPRVHEALGNVDTAEVPDGFVFEEVRRGYKIRERLLRPALVRVASNSQGKQA